MNGWPPCDTVTTHSSTFPTMSCTPYGLTHELRLPPGNSLVKVYLFEQRDRYESFMNKHYPHLPQRRAFFVAQPRFAGAPADLLVYTYVGDGGRIQKDLRHELTHALLHSVLKEVPLWLDDGLAEDFELPPNWNGLNRTHAQVLRDKGSRPNLARLEQLSEVKDMDSDRYREAWAWVYLMLRGSPEAKEVLLAYLQQLRTKPNPGPLQPRLAAAVPSLDDVLDRLLVQLVDDRGAERR